MSHDCFHENSKYLTNATTKGQHVLNASKMELMTQKHLQIFISANFSTKS